MVPKLRFKNYNRIEEKKIINFAPLQRGYDLPVSQIEDGDYPVVFSNGILKKHSKYKVKGPGIVTGRSGTIGKVTYVKGNFWPHNTSLFVTDFFDNIPKYVYYYYQHIDFSKFSTGSGVPTLNRNDLHSLTVLVPAIEEQTKIADFLSSVDEKITLLNKQYDLLCQYKKGMMQKIFSQKLRFKDDNGKPFPKWNTLQLKDVAIRVTRKNKENNNTILTISGRDGLVDQMTYFNKQIASKNVTGYYLIRKGEFAYNKSYSQGYPMGAIKMLSSYEKGVVSTLYICFKLNDEQSCDFYQHYFESGLQNRAIEKVAQEGARNHGLLNIGVNDFFDIELQVPGLAEQNKIAHFLSAIEDKIAVKRAELNMLKNWKQGLLQQMFV
ncbi:hypothetical protein CF026_26395 [Klebsiella michiganensis]|nr:hypothetical protein [Klebsiella michiganensis]MBW6001670.1 hypothetical protein [Klebsiella michiganensis]